MRLLGERFGLTPGSVHPRTSMPTR
jgi:hypothetical protein